MSRATMEITTAGLTPLSGQMKPVALVAIARTMKADSDVDEACARKRSLRANTPTTSATILMSVWIATRI
jgi:hypothetical protein